MSLQEVQSRVAAAAARTGRDPGAVTIVVVSKGRSADEISRLYDAGHRDFGENRAGELAEKSARLPADIRWHYVGHLQTNKARLVRPSAAMLHSLDRESLATAWLKGPGRVPPALIQVNIGREPQKHGVAPERAGELAVYAVGLGVPVVGVMAILPIVAEPEQARPYFSELVSIRDGIIRQLPSVEHLSMGMTDDFDVAVEEGATLIRVGRAIFEPGHNL